MLPSTPAPAMRVWSSPAVDPKGNAAGQGFRVGDIILEVAGRAVKTPEDVRKAITDARNGQRRTC